MKRLKDNEEIEKIKKYSQKNVKILYNYLCLYRLYLCIVCGHM